MTDIKTRKEGFQKRNNNIYGSVFTYFRRNIFNIIPLQVFLMDKALIYKAYDENISDPKVMH